MDYNMTVVEATKLRDDLKRNIETMTLLYSTATGMDVDIQGSAGLNSDGSAYAECSIQVNLPDKSPLAKDVSTG